MPRSNRVAAKKFRAVTRRDLDTLPHLEKLDREQIVMMKAVSAVLPFRVNEYVIDELIDWDNIPDDPMFQLTFPQGGMLDPKDLSRMMGLVRKGETEAKIAEEARGIQMSLNPHPAGQMQLNVPRIGGAPVAGVQHKYRETVLFFPSQGQTCHAYCTYCFRWAQFVGLDELKFANKDADSLVAYLREHPEVESVLFTGGDPLIMKTAVLRRYIEPLLSPEFENLSSIRIGTKANAYWPHRFVSDADADDLLALFDEVRASGRHLALMAHYSHPRELETAIAQEATRRILDTGTAIRCQAPVIAHVNDDAGCWAEMWRLQVRQGAIPYYMFVERDTGARKYFEVPLTKALDIFTEAYRQVSGLARTVRGPSMSATPGKVLVDGVARIDGEKVFVLKLIQGRDPAWVNRVFFARYDPRAMWLDDLRPVRGEAEFFFESAMRRMRKSGPASLWFDENEEQKAS